MLLLFAMNDISTTIPRAAASTVLFLIAIPISHNIMYFEKKSYRFGLWVSSLSRISAGLYSSDLDIPLIFGG